MLDLYRRIVKFTAWFSLTLSLAPVRIPAMIFAMFLGLVGFQALPQHAVISEEAVSAMQLNPHADHDVEHAHEQSCGHSEHNSNCWAHATCSPATTTTVNAPYRIDRAHESDVLDALDYTSYSFPPSSPPPRV